MAWRAEALVLTQIKRESEAECAQFELGKLRDFDADPSGEIYRDEFSAAVFGFEGGGSWRGTRLWTWQ
jgi:hypothetical protein